MNMKNFATVEDAKQYVMDKNLGKMYSEPVKVGDKVYVVCMTAMALDIILMSGETVLKQNAELCLWLDKQELERMMDEKEQEWLELSHILYHYTEKALGIEFVFCYDCF